MILMDRNDMELYLSSLEDKIRVLFCEATCTKYIGDLDLDIFNECNDTLYTLRIGLNNPNIS